MRAWSRAIPIAIIVGCLLLGTSHATPALYTPWVPAGERRPLKNLDIAFKDQDDSSGVLGSLVDKPVLITFFYTRCQNGRKCSMAVSRLGALQRELAKAGIDNQVRLLAISYEPQFDTSERINRYATDRGLHLGANALALQLDSPGLQRLLDELQAPVNFNAGWVNTHGVELSLLDNGGRLVRKYQTLLWDNDQVMQDLRRVLAER
jgi:protein SCO1